MYLWTVRAYEAGTVEEMEDYCRRPMDIVGKDTGFILSSGCPASAAYRLPSILYRFSATSPRIDPAEAGQPMHEKRNHAVA